MRLKEFCEATGVSARRIRYWEKNGIYAVKDNTTWKMGLAKNYDEKMIPRVKLIGQLAKERRIPVGILHVIFYMYETGWVQISGPPNGVRMEWDPET